MIWFRLALLMLIFINPSNVLAICYPDIDSKREIVFPETNVGETTTENIVIKNISVCQNSIDGKLEISQISIENSEFIIKEDSCSNTSLTQGNSCLVTVDFKPANESKSIHGKIIIPSNGYHEELPNNPGTYSTNPMEVKLIGSAVVTTFSADHSANNTPNNLSLLLPQNNSTVKPNEVTFKWHKATDPNGKNIDYFLFYCEDEEMINCTVEEVNHEYLELIGRNNIEFIYIIGSIIPVFLIRRKKYALMLIILISTLFSACDDGDFLLNKILPNITTNENEISLTASDLKNNNTYFWKVTAVNESGEKTESEIWKFNTN